MKHPHVKRLFKYPAEPHQRRHHPPQTLRYQPFKRWLRDEFAFRCVYCLCRETWRGGHRGFGVEHFQPKSIRADLRVNYRNLLYACNRCNSKRRDISLPETWHPEESPFHQHLLVQHDGCVAARTRIGEQLAGIFDLNESDLVAERVTWIETFAGLLSMPADEPWVKEMLRRHFGYPTNLPVLRSPHAQRPYCNRPPCPYYLEG